MRALDNLVYVFLTNAQEEIEKCMKRNLFEDMDGVVTKQSMNFRHQIQGNAGNNLHCIFLIVHE